MPPPRAFTPRRAALAFVVSPLVAPIVFVAYGTLFGQGVEVSGATTVVYALVVAAHAYAAALLIGLPLFLLRPRGASTRYFVIGGAAAGFLLMGILWRTDGLALGAVSGAFAGFVFSRFGRV